MASLRSKVRKQDSAPLRTLIVYPFFAHYRQPVLDELTRHGTIKYTFMGAHADPDGQIAPGDVHGTGNFIQAEWLRISWLRLNWQRNVVSTALRGNFDCYIFLGNAAWPSTWIAALVARVRGKLVLFWTHGWLKREAGLKGVLRNTFYRIAHGLLLYGQRAKQIGIQSGFAANSLHVIYNSLDYEKQLDLQRVVSRQSDLAQLRSSLFPGAERPIVIATGRLTKVKRFDLLLRAVAILDASQPVHVLVVGDGPERDSLVSLAASLGLAINFFGACYDEPTLAKLFGLAAVLVSPGNIGLTCMHSLAYGVPVITHDAMDEQMPEAEAIQSGINGDLFRYGSVADLARCIVHWTAHARPADLARSCQESIAARYTPAAQREAIEQAIRDGLMRGGQPR